MTLTAATELSSRQETTLWAILVTAIIFIIILSNAYSGWKEGLYRKSLSIIALILSYIAAWIAGPFLGKILRLNFTYPQLLLDAVGSCIIGATLWMFICLLIKIFVPKTKDYAGTWRSSFVGITGMCMGAILGLAYGTLLFVFIKFAGTLSEVKLNTHATHSQISHSDIKSSESQRPPTLQTQKKPNMQVKSMKILAKIKASTPKSMFGPMVSIMDPIPHKAYRIINKVEEIIHNDEALKRLKNQPRSQELLQHPDILAMTKDKELQELAKERNFKKFLQHPKIIKVADNTDLLMQFKDYDIELAIDEALGI